MQIHLMSITVKLPAYEYENGVWYYEKVTEKL